ncbi:MAG: hypothetical protein K2Z80_34870 [Xanthobacteraceae bacterium]|nr:hypothetical protein [Xanthobacteraceae bacterium]
MRHLFVAACLAAVFSLVHISGSQAGSVKGAANAWYSSAGTAPVSRAADQVPANCIREACGRLFCWNTGSRR